MAEPFRLVWSSSAGCHDVGAFLAELTERTTRLREARADEHAITLIVETFRSEGGVRGQLTARRPDGDLTVREVPGVSCHEVEAAMALIAALMVDPLAGQARRRRLEPAFQPDSPPPKPAAWSLRAEHRLSARTATSPNLAWGQALGSMLTYEAGATKPSLALFAEQTDGTAAGQHGSADLELAAVRLAICPLGVQPARGAWDLRACATGELGRLLGSGVATAAPASKAIVWSAAGLDLQARYELLAPLWLGLEGGFTFPFTRERFYVDPGETLHRVPGWGLAFGVGLGLRFF